jgi:hypothetical protein
LSPDGGIVNEIRETNRELKALTTEVKVVDLAVHNTNEGISESNGLLKQISRLLGSLVLQTVPVRLTITQIGSIDMPTNNSIVLGQVGTFVESPVPVGSLLPAGTIPTWTADDPNVALTASADGTSVAVATSTTDTAASFNLTCTATFINPATGASVTITSGLVNIALLPAVVSNLPTALSISQVS